MIQNGIKQWRKNTMQQDMAPPKLQHEPN
jgi:hypothetical protein